MGEVQGRFYLLAADLYKLDGNHGDYYRASLRYLGCTDLDTLSLDRKRDLAFHLCLAALLGKDVYNFGELLAHTILKALEGSENEWIVNLLFAFNAGDVSKFENTRPRWSQQMDLNSSGRALDQKIRLLALMEMTFQRGANNRLLTFKDVAQQTQLPEEDVELLVMKALAKGLVKGSIDQVDRTVNLSWVQPRVLDKDQVKTLMAKIANLSTSIGQMEHMIENNASDILTI